MDDVPESLELQPVAPRRPNRTRIAVAIGVTVILAGILGSTVVNRPIPSPDPSADPSAVAATTSPSATANPWADLVLDPYVAVADLAPDDVDAIGLATTTTFTLRSRTATPAVDLAKGLRISPPTDFTVTPGPTPDVATVQPATALASGTRYRFRLETPDGALAGTWAYVTRGPVHVSGTLPADLAVAVPANTGIEVTFDQDGTVGVEKRFTIEPVVAGRIEQHDRTWAFIPDKPLPPATIYTVTIAKGVALEGSTETLEADVTFRFETAVAGPVIAARIGLAKTIIELRPGEEPAIGTIDEGDDEKTSSLPDTIPVTIHRLPTFGAVEAAGLALTGPDSWAEASPSAVIATAGLDLVASVDATLVHGATTPVLRIPVKLAEGYYVATLDQPGPAVQALLQVTNVAAFAQSATGTTVVWVNDMATGRGLDGATVTVVGGASIGTTSAGGLLRAPTPEALRIDRSGIAWYDDAFRAANLLAVTAADGRRLLVPLGLTTSWMYEEPSSWYVDPSSRWWLLFETDRTTYRQTDTIHAFGTLRARSDRSVPGGIELRLRPQEGAPDAWLQRVPVTATKRGVFAADVHLDQLPRANYSLELFVGSERVSSLWIVVQDIRKPAYQVKVTAARHAYLLGEIAHVSAAVSFYDGTVVPGVDLQFGAFDGTRTATADGLGSAAVDMRTTLEGDQAEGIHWAGIDVRPAHPEEGEITGSTTVLVAPSRVWIDADGTISGGRLVIDGSLSWVDLAAIDASAAVGDFEVDPAGKPIAGGSVRATITHLVPVKRQIGTMYDFIEKRVVPQYEYDVDEVLLGTKTLTSASNGSVHLSMAVPNPGDGYRVVLTASDPERRPIQRTIYAAAGQTDPSSARPYLEYRGACGGTPQRVSGLNEPVTLTMHDGDGSVADGRFLFLVAERGAVEATIQDAATFARVLADRDLPGFTVRAIWLSGNGYALSTVNAVVDPADKTITIKLTPDQSRYEPGDPVTVGVTTTDATGKPMAADVVIQGVDEKLYTLGQAFDFDPRAELLALPDAGFLQAYRSHATPRDDDGGCGAEGGSRDDFRDTVVFQRIATDAQGRGSVSFDLSDDLTSWHLSAVAVSDAFDSGSASVVIPVGLPFAVDATLAPEYLVGEQVVLRVRGFGGKLVTGNKIRFSVSAPSLGLANTTVDAAAFESGRVALPALVAGDHEIRIAGETTVDGVVLRDSLVRTIHVIETRLGTLTSNYEALGPGFAPAGGEGFTRYVITDEGRGRLIGTLERLAGARSARFDRNAAAELARQVLIDEYDVPPASLAAIGFDPQLYQPSGISLLPYSTADTFLTARAVLLATSAITGEDLREPLLGWAESGTTSEQRVAAYAGLAALGDDVVASLRALDLPTATVRERIWVALGLAASGDEQGARAIERAVLEANGERLGRWVRLNGDVSIDRTLEVTALLMVLAARLGDPIADDLARYLTDNPSPTTVFPLEELAYVQATLERLPRTSGRFAWTIAGERTEVALERGGAYTLVLTPGQRATFTLQPIEGSLGVATTWTAAGAALPATTGVKVTRTVTPGGSTTEDRLVHVAFTVAFGQSPVSGCYRLSDLVPSGLAPVASTGVLYEEDEPLNLVRPYEVDGQRVSWCVAPRVGSYTYGYSARVVSPGTYRWEPAVLQAERAPTIGGSTEATTYTIR